MYPPYHGPNGVCRVCPILAHSMPYRHCSTCSSFRTDQMLLRLIFISVNTGLSSALFALLAVTLVRLDTLPTQHLPDTHHVLSGSLSYTRPISSSQPCIIRSARCIATRSSRASIRARSSEVASVRHRNPTRLRQSNGSIPSSRMRTRARSGRRFKGTRFNPAVISRTLSTCYVMLSGTGERIKYPHPGFRIACH